MGPPKGNPSFGVVRSGVGSLGHLHAPALSLMDPSLESTETMRHLLSIAAGDFSVITVAECPGTASGVAGGSLKGGAADSIGHGGAASLTSHLSFVNSSRTASNGGETRQAVSTTAPSLAGPRLSASTSSLRTQAARTSPVSDKQSIVQGGAISGCADAMSDMEARVFYLTVFVAQALRLEDYWVHLGHQIEVDQHVEMIQYCAREGFNALKTVHLLDWWRQYRLLVRSGASSPTGSGFAALRLSDGNPQKTAPPHHHHGGSGGGGTGAAEHGSTSSGAGSQGKDSSSKASRKARAMSVSFTGTAPLNTDTDGSDGGAAAALSAPVQSLTYATQEEALLGELQRFAQWELEHEWAWRQVPREPLVNTGAMPVSPRSGSITSGSRRATQNAAAPSTAKTSRTEKAKLQQLQQQEMEAEEQRLARVASMPPENIFLTKDQIDGFLQFIIKEDFLAHLSLHSYVASHSQQLACTSSRLDRKPVCFMVQVDTPMSVLPLREATRVSTFPHGVGVSEASASPALRDGATNIDATGGSAVGALHSPLKASASGGSKSAGRRQRSRSKRASKDASAVSPAESTAAPSNTFAGPDTALPLTAMEALRAEQAKEAAAYRAAYDEELAQEAVRQQALQHAADVDLFFENSSSDDAVKAVYSGIEEEMTARQQRILQRIVALERALGIAPASSDGSPLGSVPPTNDGNHGAVVESRVGGLRSTSNIGTSSTKKKVK